MPAPEEIPVESKPDGGTRPPSPGAPEENGAEEPAAALEGVQARIEELERSVDELKATLDGATREGETPTRIEGALDYVLTKNAELYRRLAR